MESDHAGSDPRYTQGHSITVCLGLLAVNATVANRDYSRLRFAAHLTSVTGQCDIKSCVPPCFETVIRKFIAGTSLFATSPMVEIGAGGKPHSGGGL